MRFLTDLEAKEAFLEGDNQKMGAPSGNRGLLAAGSSVFLCHCLLLGGGEDLSPPWRCCRARRAVTGFGDVDGGRCIFQQRRSLPLCCWSHGHGASWSESRWGGSHCPGWCWGGEVADSFCQKISQISQISQISARSPKLAPWAASSKALPECCLQVIPGIFSFLILAPPGSFWLGCAEGDLSVRKGSPPPHSCVQTSSLGDSGLVQQLAKHPGRYLWAAGAEDRGE